MKLAALFLLLLSFSAMAITEVECSGRGHGKDVRVSIDGRWNQGYFKTGTLWVRENDETKTTRLSLNYRAPWGGINRAEYSDRNLRLEIDLWPDAVPRWGRNYFGNLWLYEENETIMMDCRFPFASTR